MSAPRAKNTDSRQLHKRQVRIAELMEENKGLRLSIMNIRQMYEGSIGEKQSILLQLTNVQHLLVGAALTGRGNSITIKEKTLASLGEYAGVDTKDVDGDLVITALTLTEVEAMQADLEEEE